ncbi:MAG: GspH/FimT family protein [Pseudomonas sp.]|nr:GspH/FimT family protein [Pseudomonas sp.]
MCIAGTDGRRRWGNAARAAPARAPACARPAGFTLLELLVVLVIAGVLAGLVGPALQRFIPGAQLKGQSRHLLAQLRQARSQAILLHQAVRVSYDEGRHGVNFSPEQRFYRLPAELQLDVQRGSHGDPQEDEEVDTSGAISFYPQGYSSGGALRLSAADGREFELQVDWLTGRVHLDD